MRDNKGKVIKMINTIERIVAFTASVFAILDFIFKHTSSKDRKPYHSMNDELQCLEKDNAIDDQTTDVYYPDHEQKNKEFWSSVLPCVVVFLNCLLIVVLLLHHDFTIVKLIALKENTVYQVISEYIFISWACIFIVLIFLMIKNRKMGIKWILSRYSYIIIALMSSIVGLIMVNNYIGYEFFEEVKESLLFRIDILNNYLVHLLIIVSTLVQPILSEMYLIKGYELFEDIKSPYHSKKVPALILSFAVYLLALLPVIAYFICSFKFPIQ